MPPVYHKAIPVASYGELQVKQYKVFQRRLNRLEFNLVPDDTFPTKCENYLRSKSVELFDQEMKMHIKLVNNIRRESSAKLRDFVSTI
jgi:hypothetical protein